MPGLGGQISIFIDHRLRDNACCNGATVGRFHCFLVLYLVNMLPIDGRARQIVRVIVIGIVSLLKYLAVF